MPVILMAAFALSLQKASAPEGFTPQLPFINEFRFNALDDDDDDVSNFSCICKAKSWKLARQLFQKVFNQKVFSDNAAGKMEELEGFLDEKWKGVGKVAGGALVTIGSGNSHNLVHLETNWNVLELVWNQ